MDAFTIFMDYAPIETIREIMFHMKGEELITFCRINTRADQICSNDEFWIKKYTLDFPDETIPIRYGNMRQVYERRLFSYPELPWSIVKARKAALDRQFIRVPDGKNVVMSSLFNKPNILYHTGYRIAGTAEEIAKALHKVHIDDNTIQTILNTAISSENYTKSPFAEIYEDEQQRSEILTRLEEMRSDILQVFLGHWNKYLEEGERTGSYANVVSVEDTYPELVEKNNKILALMNAIAEGTISLDDATIEVDTLSE